MNTLMNILLVVVPSSVVENKKAMDMNTTSWLFVGVIIAILLLIYLITSLIKPEKF